MIYLVKADGRMQIRFNLTMMNREW